MRTLLRRSVGAYFTLSALAKIYDIRSSVAVFQAAYPELPLPGLVVVSVVAVELILAGGLLLSERGRWVTGSAAALLVFSAVAAWGLWQGSASCGCLGAMVELSPELTLAKNVVLLVVLALSREPVSARDPMG